MVSQPGASIKEEARWRRVDLRCKQSKLGRWLPRNWHQHTPGVVYPTFVRAIRRRRPPFKPAGIKLCAKHELARWRKAEFIYPPYQFKDKYMVRKGTAPWQPVTAEMREKMMGFEVNHTFLCMPTEERRRDLLRFELARCALIGNSFHTGVVA